MNISSALHSLMNDKKNEIIISLTMLKIKFWVINVTITLKYYIFSGRCPNVWKIYFDVWPNIVFIVFFISRWRLFMQDLLKPKRQVK